MKLLTHIFWHCLYTPEGRYFDSHDVLDWHVNLPKSKGGRGWKRPGYNGIWLLDGSYEELIAFDDDDYVDLHEIANGARGWNGKAHHFAYVGGKRNGKPADTRTPQQHAAMATAVHMLVKMFPKAKHIGHNQVNPGKACPGYDVPTWLSCLGIPEQNIDRTIYY